MDISADEEKRYQELQESALQYARGGEDDLLLPMLQHGMPVNLANHKGNTLIMLASYHGHGSTVKLLLAHGADPNRVNDRGQTPISGAIFKGYTEVVEALVRGGVRLNQVVGSSKSPATSGNDALRLAALFGQKDMLKLLRKLSNEQCKGVSPGLSGKIIGVPLEYVVMITSPLRKLLGKFSSIINAKIYK